MKISRKSQGFTSLFLALILFNFSSQISGAYPDFCDEFTVGTDINLNVGESKSLDLRNCAQFFKLSVGGYTNKYIMFEVEFTDLGNYEEFWPLLVQKNGIKPNVYKDMHEIWKRNATDEDFNGLVNWKNYHSVAIFINDTTPSEVYIFLICSNNQVRYFAIYNINAEKAPEDFSRHYDVRTFVSDDYPCQKDCSGNGICRKDLKKCECFTGFFDLDCSVQATKVTLDNEITTGISSKSYSYFYFPIKRFEEILRMSFSIDKEGVVDFTFLFNKEDQFRLSNDYVSDGKYQLSPRRLEGKIMVEKGDINYYAGRNLLLGVFNNEDEAVQINIKFEDYKNSSILRTISINVAIGVSIFMFVIWVLVTSFKRITKYENSLIVLDKYHVQIELFLRNYRVEREEENILTKKDINKYFPKQKYRELTSSFSQTMCSVCLEDFESDSQCRQMYCEHIYHSDCIEAWFVKHYNCPNCKKSMTKAAIEEFLKERAKKEENKILLPKDEENQEINEDRSQDNDKSPTVITPQPMLLKTHPKDIWSARDLPRHQELSSSNQPPHNEVINLNLEDQPELVLKYGVERGESVRSNDKKRNTLEIETKSNHVTPLGSLQDGTNSRSQLRKNTNHNSIRSLKANPSAERGIIDIDLK